jgi:molybdopterin synthase catalytic subunit
MPSHISVHILQEPLAVGAAMEAVRDPGHGAIDLFVGVVRNLHVGKQVSGITYDVHKPLALCTMHAICEEGTTKWHGSRFYVAHYHGSLAVGEISVLIAVSTPHRADCFEACRYVIEAIKTRLPVWKQEHYLDGKSAWLPGHSLNG